MEFKLIDPVAPTGVAGAYLFDAPTPTVELRAGRVLRIGHKGAAALAPEKHAALAPENTLRSLALAVELGCDLVEFDVLSLDDGTLVLAHSDDLREVSHGSSHGRVRPLAAV